MEVGFSKGLEISWTLLGCSKHPQLTQVTQKADS